MTPKVVTPDHAFVGETSTWRITYLAAQPLGLDAVLTLRRGYHSQLRIQWQTDDPSALNYVCAEGPDGVALDACAEGNRVALTVSAGQVRTGDRITITLGSGRGLQMWPVVHDLELLLEVEPAGERHHLRIPVRAGPATKLLIRNPSVATQGSRVDALVRPVDEHGNTARTFEGAVAVRSDGLEGAASEAEFRASDAGLQRVSGVALGSHTPVRITAEAPGPGLRGMGNPMEVVNSPEEDRIFWGDLHCHSSMAQALEEPEFLYAYARDEEALDFICHTEHDAGTPKRWIGPRWREWQPPVESVPEYIEATWERRKQLVRQYHEPDRFVTFLGYEWASNLYGHMNVYYGADDAPIFYPDSFWQEDFTPAVLWERLAGIEAFTVPHHVAHRIRSQPGGFVSGWDWSFYDEHRVPLVEIYSKHGNSEYFGCPRRIADQVPEGCVQAALERGCKVGFIANTDTHASRPGSDLAGDLFVRQGGLTAVFAPRLERETVFDALRRRRCYGTSGQRIIVRFWVNRAFMGEDVRLDDAREPKAVRVQVEGTAPLAQVQVVKNGQVLHAATSATASLAADFADESTTGAVDWYCLRVVQEDGEMAWGSPIWVTPA